MVVLKLRAGGVISPCRWCSGGGIHTKKAGVTKTQVKAIRKKLKVFNHYEFKTSKKFHVILLEIIDALEECGIPIKNEFAKPHKLFRDTLVYDQYSAIRVAAANSEDQDIHVIATKLEGMRKEIDE